MQQIQCASTEFKSTISSLDSGTFIRHSICDGLRLGVAFSSNGLSYQYEQILIRGINIHRYQNFNSGCLTKSSFKSTVKTLEQWPSVYGAGFAIQGSWI